MDLQTAYGVLGVRPGASEREVRDAHQRLSATWQSARFQPDPTQRQQAESAVAQIQQALESIARAGFPSTPGVGSTQAYPGAWANPSPNAPSSVARPPNSAQAFAPPANPPPSNTFAPPNPPPSSAPNAANPPPSGPQAYAPGAGYPPPSGPQGHAPGAGFPPSHAPNAFAPPNPPPSGSSPYSPAGYPPVGPQSHAPGAGYSPSSGPQAYAPGAGYAPSGSPPYAPGAGYPPPSGPQAGGVPYPPPYPGAPPFGSPGAPNPFAPDVEAQRAKKRSRAIAQIGIGLLLVIVGAAITASTHDAAVRGGGGTYVIAYGPIIFGVISFFRGLIGLLSP